ncbi:ORF072 [Staphylococcus phage 71]|uniref:ORF072 n=1 Tax=Staphylococcus phage 71 TaxID=2936816 RepID=Q4ZBF4_9CAUD|nr:ORF072 [Staphylococcus phage 71]AAX91627.1 ORF072 [Staphylococcus phage 71]
MHYVDNFFTAVIIAFMLFLLYWMGRIDGFNKGRTISYIDIQISKSIRHFQNIVFRNARRFYKTIKNLIRK